ncbi:MAG: PD-(D/E)XK nuclease family protein [Gemmatimonadetes bacterium]|nr:PD-(D/E)XK nuclease family protein [Gemmatimonadota bacterium]
MTTPNLYSFATKELAQDATIAYILAWADPKYRQSHPRLHALGTKLLCSLLRTQEIDIPIIKTLRIKTQVTLRIKTQNVRIDILVRINMDQNANRIILIIEDKVGTTEHSNQIKYYKKAVERNYKGCYEHLVAVYLKTGNESKEYLPPKNKCGSFMRRDLLDVMDGFQNTQNTIVNDFRTHLQRWEDNTNRWKSECYRKWQWQQWEGFYSALESMWRKKGDWCGWVYYPNPKKGFLACWLYDGQQGEFNQIQTQYGYVELFMQIHDAMRLTVRLGSGNTGHNVTNLLMWQVFNVLRQINGNTSSDIRIKKAGVFRGGKGGAVADITFGNPDPWFAVDSKGIVNMDATVKRLCRVQELLRKVVEHLNQQGIVI